MKIERKKRQIVELGEMKYGECFFYEDGIYMKTDSSHRNAVDLETGECRNVADWIYVAPVEVEAVVLDD